MSNNLLNRSLSDIARQDKMRSSGGRASPYARNSPRSSAPDEGKWAHDMFEGNAGARAPGRVQESGPSPKLRIEGLHYEVSEPELKELFARIGPVQKAFIKYDKSGRSTGAAIVQYETVGHAVAAKREYDGANAKGQPISIFFEAFKSHPPRAPAAMQQQQGVARGAKGGADLLSRLSSGSDLAGRIGGGRSGAPPPNAPRGPASQQQQQRPGPHRSASGGPVRGARGGARGGRGGGRGGAEAKKAPATASDLDKELEDFMKAPASKEAAKSIHAPKDAQGDVEMV